MHKYKNIRRIHLGITSKCNLSCPMCIRNVNGGPTNPNVVPQELSLKDIKKAIPPDLVRQLRYIYCCGNTGDPMLATDLLDIMKYFRECSEKTGLCFHTNASGRSKEWWIEMGKTLNRPHDIVRFSIDGLKDTNHLYRKGANFDKIIESIKAFVGAGGVGGWEFIPFRHNQHQIDEARNLAKDLGLKSFQIIKSGRFAAFEIDGIKRVCSWKNSHPVYSKGGKLQYIIEPPDENYSSKVRKVSDIDKVDHEFPEQMDVDFEPNKQYMNFKDFEKSIPEVDNLNDVKIDCKCKKEGGIYISEEGFLFPCCWTQYQMYSMHLSFDVKQIRNLAYNFGLDRINVKNKSIKEIIELGWLDLFEKTWSLKSTKEGKLISCSRHCSVLSHVQDEYEIQADRFMGKNE